MSTSASDLEPGTDYNRRLIIGTYISFLVLAVCLKLTTSVGTASNVLSTLNLLSFHWTCLQQILFGELDSVKYAILGLSNIRNHTHTDS